MSRLSRRQWLAQAGAASLGMALAGCSWSNPRPQARYRVSDAGVNHALGHRLRSDAELPAPTRTERVSVAIIGGGVAGLSAAWALRRAGVDDFVLLELENQAGGNASGGHNAISGYPWGAHYVPIVNRETQLTWRLFEELGIITGTDAAGRPRYDELALVHDPVERLYYRGKWYEGLEPTDFFDPEGRAQFDRLERAMAALEARTDARGRRWFSIPTSAGSDAAELRQLDAMSFADWLRAEGYTAKSLLWYLDYCVRDDYGLRLDQTSAWGGLHYFAARVATAANADDEAVLTWPEGNAYLVRRLAEPLTERLHTGWLARHVRTEGQHVLIDALITAGECRRLTASTVIICTPLHITARLCPELNLATPAALGLVHNPWAVCNVSVAAMPESRGAALAWDNVSYHSGSLGYINATHQAVGRRDPRTVLTWYQPLCDGDARAMRLEAHSTPAEAWAARAVADLERMHPGITEQVTEVAVRVWGHGMAGPNVGARFHPGLAALRQPLAGGRIALAHTDCSALSIFEEAQALGVNAALQVLKRLGHPAPQF